MQLKPSRILHEKHVPVLDAIRGLAILLVILYHVVGDTPAPDGFLGRTVFGIAKSGWVGVDLFFVLSGFLITGILYDTRASTNYFRAFYARRFLRIFPIYYGFLLLLIAFTYPLEIDWKGRQFIYLAYLQNTGIVKHIFSHPISPFLNIGHLWSLAVEEQFYCVWPALVFLLKDRVKLMRLALLLTACSFVLRVLMLRAQLPVWDIYAFTPSRADSLMLGALLALALRSEAGDTTKLTRTAWYVLPTGLCLLIGLAWPRHTLTWMAPEVAIFGYTVIALVSAAFLTLSLTRTRFQAIVNRTFMRWLGKYSYGIYILHQPMIGLVHSFTPTQNIEKAFPSPWVHAFISVIAIMLAIAAAVLSFRFYESKFLRLKRFFEYDLPQPEPAPKMESAGRESAANATSIELT